MILKRLMAVLGKLNVNHGAYFFIANNYKIFKPMKRLNNWRWLVAAVFILFAIIDREWLFLIVPAYLIYQIYFVPECMACEAGFCRTPKTKEDES